MGWGGGSSEPLEPPLNPPLDHTVLFFFKLYTFFFGLKGLSPADVFFFFTALSFYTLCIVSLKNNSIKYVIEKGIEKKEYNVL